MSIQNLANPEAYVANADLSTKQYYAMALDAQGDGVDVAGAGVKAGFLQNKPVSGGTAEVSFEIGRTSYAVIADASSSVGDLMKTDSAGKLTVTTTAGDEVVASMLEATSAADAIAKVRIESRVAD